MARTDGVDSALLTALLCLCFCSPDLSSLEHQQHLSSLDITVPPGSCWSLHTLQLGHLVHLSALKELRLAECCSADSSTRETSGGTASSSSGGGRGGFNRRCLGGYQTCSKSSRYACLPVWQ